MDGKYRGGLISLSNHTQNIELKAGLVYIHMTRNQTTLDTSLGGTANGLVCFTCCRL